MMKIDNWSEYWNEFDALCFDLDHSNKNKTASELREAKRFVNGLTDGWYGFYDNFKKTIDNSEELEANETERANQLINILKKTLEKR